MARPKKLKKSEMEALVGKHVMVTAEHGLYEWLGYCDDDDGDGLIVYGLLGEGYHLIPWKRRVREATPEEITGQGFTEDETTRMDILRDDLLDCVEAMYPLTNQYARTEDGYHLEIHPATGICPDGQVRFERIRVDLGMVLELFDTEPSITVDSNGVFIDGTIDEGTEILVAIDFEPPMHDKPTYQVTEKGWKDYTPPAHRPSPNPSLN